MKAEELLHGKVYVVAGMGPMRIEELPNPPRKTTITMRTPDGCNYYATAEQVVREVDQAYVQEHFERVNERIRISNADKIEWKKFIQKMEG